MVGTRAKEVVNFYRNEFSAARLCIWKLFSLSVAISYMASWRRERVKIRDAKFLRTTASSKTAVNSKITYSGSSYSGTMSKMGCRERGSNLNIHGVMYHI